MTLVTLISVLLILSFYTYAFPFVFRRSQIKFEQFSIFFINIYRMSWRIAGFIFLRLRDCAQHRKLWSLERCCSTSCTVYWFIFVWQYGFVWCQTKLFLVQISVDISLSYAMAEKKGKFSVDFAIICWRIYCILSGLRNKTIHPPCCSHSALDHSRLCCNQSGICAVLSNVQYYVRLKFRCRITLSAPSRP